MLGIEPAQEVLGQPDVLDEEKSTYSQLSDEGKKTTLGKLNEFAKNKNIQQ